MLLWIGDFLVFKEAFLLMRSQGKAQEQWTAPTLVEVMAEAQCLLLSYGCEDHDLKIAALFPMP